MTGWGNSLERFDLLSRILLVTTYTVLPADSCKVDCQLCWRQCSLTLTAVKRRPKTTEGLGPRDTILQFMTHEQWRPSAIHDSCVALRTRSTNGLLTTMYMPVVVTTRGCPSTQYSVQARPRCNHEIQKRVFQHLTF